MESNWQEEVVRAGVLHLHNEEARLHFALLCPLLGEVVRHLLLHHIVPAHPPFMSNTHTQAHEMHAAEKYHMQLYCTKKKQQ